jgi:hypothetical protein
MYSNKIREKKESKLPERVKIQVEFCKIKGAETL